MSTRRIVVIGASSGGIDALRQVLGRLPAGFPAPICVVVHVSPQSPRVLHTILKRAGPLDAVVAEDEMKLRPGLIYVAPPDHHLLVEPGVVCVTRGPKENRFRPAIDPLFRSAAQTYGPAAAGVILSGNLDDGTAGLMTIKQLGGVAIVQDPHDAMFPSMPQSALNHVNVDYCVPADQISEQLVRVVSSEFVETRVDTPETVGIEVRIAKEDSAVNAGVREIGEPSNFACPDCHGVLLRVRESNPLRFRCQTGHAYTAESLLAHINENIEDALWVVIRSLEEGRLLLQHLQEHHKSHEGAPDRTLLEAQLVELTAHSDALRKLVTERTNLTTASE
jgi:two-component system chemotaxis response regulator CheB